MTDAQIAEIYAIAREAFNGGQREIQIQSYPFRMTAENLAKHRLDPNIAFWKELKNGADHFEVTKTEAVGAGLRQALRLRRQGRGEVCRDARLPDAASRRPGRGQVAAKEERRTTPRSPSWSPRA